MNTTDIRKMLQAKYGGNEWAWMEEVRNAAGFGANRSADFFAMNLWPSRGLSTHGFEIKSFRGDWLKELKSPQKVEQGIYKFCDYWWLIAGDHTVAKLEEIPETWGYMFVKGSRFIVAKEAPKNKPDVFSRDFVACLLKRANEGKVSKSVVEERVEESIKARLEYKDKYYKDEVERLKNDIRHLEKNIQEFENYSGVKMGSWYGPEKYKKIGEAVKFILDGGIKSSEDKLRNLHKWAKDAFDFIDNVLKFTDNDNIKQDVVDDTGSLLHLPAQDADGV